MCENAKRSLAYEMDIGNAIFSHLRLSQFQRHIPIKPAVDWHAGTPQTSLTYLSPFGPMVGRPNCLRREALSPRSVPQDFRPVRSLAGRSGDRLSERGDGI
jgi:hypothetical protein